MALISMKLQSENILVEVGMFGVPSSCHILTGEVMALLSNLVKNAA